MDRVSEIEIKYVKEVLSKQFRTSSGGIMMKRFEDAFAKRFGSKFGISFINGTATMHASLEALGVNKGDEVIVPPLTMSATAFAVLQANATPVFADVDLDTFQISADAIKNKISDNTKAIITVSLYGLSPDIDQIKKIIGTYDIKIIEDNAECFLGKYKGRLVGKLGHCSSFSFQSSKHLTSGEGGIVLTDDEQFANNLRRIQSLGYAGVSAKKGKISKLEIQSPNYDRHMSMGWNYRMPELCCAVALAQTERIDELVQKRVEVAKIFSEAVKEFQSWFKPQFVPKEYVHSYWTWAALLKRDDVTWLEFRNKFASNGGDGVYGAWKLTYLEPMFKNLALLNREKFINQNILNEYTQGLCKNAEWLQQRLFQFKTNYWKISDAKRQAEILFKTLNELS